MYCLSYSQKLPLSQAECWDFFSAPNNLRKLTPASLDFQILNEVEERMYPGQIISYIIRPLWNIPVHWVTEITHVKEPHYFIDEQRLGPFPLWHHEHRFVPIPGGTEMQDKVYYKLPLGPIGKALHAVKIKKDLEAIFTYRRSVLVEMFGKYHENME